MQLRISFQKSIRTLQIIISRKKRIHEEIVALELLRKKYNWMVGERISLLESKLAQLVTNEVENIKILNMELNMDIDELLEITLSEMRNHTKLFEKSHNQQLNETKIDLESNLLEHQSRIDSDGEEAQLAELELEKFNEAQLQDQAIFL